VAGAGVSITPSDPSNNITITNTGDTNAADDLTTASTAGGDLSGLFSNLQIVAGAVGTSEVADNTLTAADLSVNVVSSLDGVTNDGGDVDLVAGAGVSITPSDPSNNITITNTGDTNAADDLTTASTAGGDLSGLFSTFKSVLERSGQVRWRITP